MSTVEIVRQALKLIEEADRLQTEARVRLEPAHRARGRKGSSDHVSAVCSGSYIVSPDELPAKQAHRRQGFASLLPQLSKLALPVRQREGETDG